MLLAFSTCDLQQSEVFDNVNNAEYFQTRKYPQRQNLTAEKPITFQIFYIKLLREVSWKD